MSRNSAEVKIGVIYYFIVYYTHYDTLATPKVPVGSTEGERRLRAVQGRGIYEFSVAMEDSLTLVCPFVRCVDQGITSEQ